MPHTSSEPIRDHITEALVEARRQRQMSRNDVAKAVGVTTAALASWERADRDVSLSKLLLWAEAVGVKLTVDGSQ